MELQLIEEESVTMATIINVIISYFICCETSYLTLVHQEHKEWRESILQITEKLGKCSYKNRKKVLAKLKIRMNSYGLTGLDESQDAHIWRLIRQVENCKKNEFRILRERLISCLAAMLKSEHQRLKKEVYSKRINAIGRAFGMVVIAICIFEIIQIFL